MGRTGSQQFFFNTSSQFYCTICCLTIYPVYSIWPDHNKFMWTHLYELIFY